MRPIRLKMKGFGPYAGEETVDFTVPLEAGMFGFYGSTGAGKTSIFDAIAFALFGKSSGKNREVAGLISHFAPPDEITAVELVFDLGAKRFVVQRIPKQERANKRRDGTTLQAHQAYLFDATGLKLDEITAEYRGENIEEKQPSRVDPVIEALLGYNVAEFRQIVVLPQNDFRKMLEASTDERAPIFKKLFDVSLYEKFVEKAGEEARKLKDQIGEQRTIIATKLNGQTEEELRQQITGEEQAVEGVNQHLSECVALVDEADAQSKRGEALEVQFDNLKKAQARQQELALSASAIEIQTKRLANARAAQIVAPTEQQHVVAQRHLQECSALVEQNSNLFAEAKRRYEEAEKRVAAAKATAPEQEDLRRDIQDLERWRAVLDKAAVTEQAMHDIKLSLEEAERQQEAASKAAAGTETQLRALLDLQKLEHDHAKTLNEAENTKAQLYRDATAAGDFEARQVKRDQQKKKVAERSEACSQAQRLVRDCKIAFDLAERDLTDIQAMHVAHKLQPGLPCPACGSRDHPDPAMGNLESRGRHDAFQTAKDELANVEAAENKARGELSTAQAVLEERQAELAAATVPSRTKAELLQLLEAANDQYDKLSADTRFVDLGARIDASDRDRQKARTAMDEAKSSVAKLQREYAEQEAGLEAVLEDVPENARNSPTLNDALASQGTRLAHIAKENDDANDAFHIASTQLTKCKEAQANSVINAQKATTAAEDATKQYHDNLAHAGLDAAAYAAAKPDISLIQTLHDAIEGHKIEMASIDTRISELEAELAGETQPDLPALRKRLDGANQAVIEEREKRTILIAQLERVKALLKEVEDLSAQLANLEDRYGPVGALYAKVNGANDLKIGLSNFAIGAMFDDVLDAANHRFLRMTNNRFRMHRPEETSGGRGKRGLDIYVFDTDTQSSRPANTISGGESFQASLSLALGLSDVVQRNSGGIQLDSIFIDEGFGNLDSDALEAALDTLTGLADSARSVGLISHVDQVKDRITAGFDIEKTPSGSHIHLRV